MLLSGFAKRVIRDGDLTIIDAAGRHYRVGDGRGRRVVIRLHDKALHHGLIVDPYLHIGEAYMNGMLTLEEGSLYDFLDIFAANVDRVGAHPMSRAVDGAQSPPAPDPSIQSGPPRPGQRSASLRPVRHAVRPLPR